MKTNKKELLDSFKGGLIVSCQVQHDDPTFSVDFVVKMAKAAQWGGAVGIRANDPEQIKAIKKEVDLPVIGLWKIWHDDTDVFITPTLEAAKAVWEAGAEIIALDCTSQITHEGRPAYELLPIVKKEIPEAIIFADVSNYEEAVRAVEMGALALPYMDIRKQPSISSNRIYENSPVCAVTLKTKPMSLWRGISTRRKMP